MADRRWVAPTAAGIVGFALSVVFIRTGTWSVFDEYTHFDYVARIAVESRLPMVNDLLGQTALQAAVCERAPGFGALASACGADIVDPTRAPYGGASTATGYLPTYYVITGLGAKVLHALPLGLTWLTAVRLMGAIYLAVAAVLVVGIGRRLGASSLVALSAAVAVAAMPMVLLQFSTVNNDSLAVVLSLAAVYVFLAMRRSSALTRSLTAFGVVLLAMTVKETAVIALLVVGVLSVRDVLVDAWSSDQRWQRAWPGLVRVVASSAVVVGAVVLLRSVAYPALVGSLPDNGLQTEAIVNAQGTPPINLVAGNALRSASSVFEVPEGVLSGVWYSVGAQLLLLTALGLPLALVLRTSRARQWLGDRRLMSVSVLLGMPWFVMSFLLLLRVQGLPAFFQPRYLLPLAVLAVALSASLIRPPWWRVTLPAAGVFALAVAVGLSTSPYWSG